MLSPDSEIIFFTAVLNTTAQASTMKKFAMILLLCFVLGLVVFATWQLFAGNLAASFSTFPFLLITYLFVLKLARDTKTSDAH